MNTIYRVGLVALSAVLLLTACGKSGGGSKGDKGNTTTGATINYEDYITPVVDRRISDCVDEEQMIALLGYEVRILGTYTDSTISYESEDSLHTITLTLENMTREEFDAIASNPVVGWIQLSDLGEAACWNGGQTELIAYENGYAFSMSVQRIANAAMIGITEMILQNLRG